MEPEPLIITEIKVATEKPPIIGKKRKHIENSQEELTENEEQVVCFKSTSKIFLINFFLENL